jgi:hypothetical protein
MQIWQYWEGPMPYWITLCQESVKAHLRPKDTYRLVGLDDLPTFIPMESERLRVKAMPMASMRADYVRACLIATRGGMWLDSDCVVMSSVLFDAVDNLLRQNGVSTVAYRENDDFFMNNLFASGAPTGRGSITPAQRYYDNCYRWASAGEPADRLTYARRLYEIAMAGDASVKVLPARCVQPFDYRTTGDLALPLTAETKTKIDSAFAVMLYNYIDGKSFDMLDASDLNDMPSGISYLFKTALKKDAL